MRLAFVSPLPPAPTGIADYAAEVLSLLSGRHELHAFHAQDEVERERLPDGCTVRPARELEERHRARPYDAFVYQLGNGRAHDFVYEHLSRRPGLLVLHDLVLHHARAAFFLDSEAVRAWARNPSSGAAREAALPALAAWRAELAYSYPAQGDRLAETYLGTVGDLLPYAYPLFRIPVEASRVVAVHNGFMAAAVAEEVSAAAVVRIALPARAVTVEPARVRAIRRRLGFSDTDLVVGAFGLLTAEKRLETVARAVARAALWEPRLRLLLAGPAADSTRLEEALARAGVRPRTVLTGRLPFAELPAHVEAADLVVHLRYPTARESSAALLRILAQGRPAIVSDLENLADIPTDAVSRVDLTDEEGGVMRAILRLAGEPETRRSLGAAAAAHARHAHAPERTREGYEEALEETLRRADPAPRAWPPHWPRRG